MIQININNHNEKEKEKIRWSVKLGLRLLPACGRQTRRWPGSGDRC